MSERNSNDFRILAHATFAQLVASEFSRRGRLPPEQLDLAALYCFRAASAMMRAEDAWRQGISDEEQTL
jgi:hypothetical protein